MGTPVDFLTGKTKDIIKKGIEGWKTSGGQSQSSSNTSGSMSPTYGEMINSGNLSAAPVNAPAPTYGEVLNGSSSPSGTVPVISEPLGSLASASTGSLDTHEQYVQNAQVGLGDIYTDTTKYYIDQNKQTIDAINEQKTADDTYSQNVYDKEMESHTNIKNEGTTLAEGQRDLALEYGSNARDISYKAAEETRAEADRITGIERERNMVNANTSYAQNRATYGANAERLGRMGLTGSGYSDYLDSKAYATYRGETQAAAARAEKANREALYAEKQAKLDADSAFNQVEYNAKSTYLNDMYDVNTTYEKNTTTSELDKLGRDHETDSTARQNTLAANTEMNKGLHDASVSYREGILGTEKDLATHQTEEERRDEDQRIADENERNSAYLTILSDPGAYSAEDIDALAKEYGFSGEQISSLKTAVENSKTETTQAIYEGLLQDVKNGVYTTEEVEMIAKNKGITDESLISSLTSAAEAVAEPHRRFLEGIKYSIGDGSYTVSDLKAHLAIGDISKDEYTECVSLLNKVINSNTKRQNVVFSSDDHNTTTGAAGNNFYVKLPKIVNGKQQYEVQYAGGSVTTDPNVFEAMKNVKNNEVFGYMGNLYIKKSGKLYMIEAAPEKTDDYETLYKWFYRAD